MEHDEIHEPQYEPELWRQKMNIKTKFWIMDDKISRKYAEFNSVREMIDYIEDLQNNVRILEFSAVFDYTEA